MGRDQDINVRGVRKKLIPTLLDDLEGFKTLLEEVTAAMEITRELKSEVECQICLNAAIS